MSAHFGNSISTISRVNVRFSLKAEMIKSDMHPSMASH